MDTSDPDIVFDEAGRCNHCTKFLGHTRFMIHGTQSDSSHLGALLERVRASGRGRDYDCVVGISGGVDSCYSAYVAKSLGLRPLAVHLDNGWNSDIAVKNIKSVAERTGIDYTSYVLDWGEFRDLQLAFFKASVPEIETPTDIAIPAALHRVAAKHGVKFIISGGNYATEGILPKSWHYNAKDLRYLKAIHQRFGTRPLSTFPTFGFRDEAYFKLVRGIRFLYLLDLVTYSRTEAASLLEEKLGWQGYGGKHHESRITAFVQSYVLPVKFNIDYRRATLSSQICTGAVTRETALAELTKPPYDPAKVAADKIFVAKKFEISVAELDRLLALPPKSYRDYPNHERLLTLGYSMYRRLHPQAVWLAGAGRGSAPDLRQRTR